MAAAAPAAPPQRSADPFEGFDLNAYIDQYPARDQIPRLLAIAKHNAHSSIGETALLTVYERLQGSNNTQLLREIAAKLFTKGHSQVVLDEQLISTRERDLSRQLEKLQTALGVAQNTLVKEQVRQALNELSEFYFSRGDITNCLKQLNRSREACTTEEHLFNMCAQGIRYNLATGNFVAAGQFLQRAETLIDRLGPDEFLVVRVVGALLQIDKKQYKSAAQALLELRKNRAVPVDFRPIAQFLLPKDLCLVATLTAVATFDRNELSKFVQNADLKVLFESEPLLSTFANAFYECQYAKALSALRELYPRIRLEFFLQTHANTLINHVRTAAMKQYTFPFSTLNLRQMAEAFNMTLSDLRRELIGLIQKGTIQARIDMANDVLYATSADSREKAFDAALSLADDFVSDAEAVMRTISMLRHGVYVKTESRLRPGSGALRSRFDRFEMGMGDFRGEGY